MISLGQQAPSEPLKKPPYLAWDIPLLEIAPLIAHLIRVKAKFVPSRLYASVGLSHDLKRRSSYSLSNDVEITAAAQIILDFISKREPQVCATLEMKRFSWGKIDYSCVHYGNGAFFKTHRDLVPNQPGPRMLSFVYFFHGEPKAFQGGDLVFFDEAYREIGRVSPVSGRLVVFRSTTPHEVEPVEMVDSAFSGGRFAITGFIRRPANFKDAVSIGLRKYLRRFKTLVSLKRKISSLHRRMRSRNFNNSNSYN